MFAYYAYAALSRISIWLPLPRFPSYYFILLACNMRCCVTAAPPYICLHVSATQNTLQQSVDKANTINERHQRFIVFFFWSGRTALHWQVCRLLLIYAPTKCCNSGLCAFCHFIISSIFFYAWVFPLTAPKVNVCSVISFNCFGKCLNIFELCKGGLGVPKKVTKQRKAVGLKLNSVGGGL